MSLFCFFQNLKENKALVPPTPQLNHEEENTAKTDAAKAEFSKLHIQKVLKAQGSDDALNGPDAPADKKEAERQAEKPRSKLVSIVTHSFNNLDKG